MIDENMVKWRPLVYTNINGGLFWAVQFQCKPHGDYDNYEQVRRLCGWACFPAMKQGPDQVIVVGIHTKYGKMSADHSDWIVEVSRGEFVVLPHRFFIDSFAPTGKEELGGERKGGSGV